MLRKLRLPARGSRAPGITRALQLYASAARLALLSITAPYSSTAGGAPRRRYRRRTRRLMPSAELLHISVRRTSLTFVDVEAKLRL